MNNLFPVLGYDSVREKEQRLFPVSENTETNIEGQDRKPDWLHNASFKPDIRLDAEQKPDRDCGQCIDNSKPDDVKHITTEDGSIPDSRSLSSDISVEDDFSRSPTRKKVQRPRDSSVSDESDTEKKRNKKKKKHKHKHKKHKHKHETYKHLSDNGQQIDRTSYKPANKVFREEVPGLEAKDAFRIDRKPDKNTYTYGSLYKLHVAQYKQHFNTSLTSDHKSQVHMKLKSKKEKVKENRYYDKEGRRLLRAMPEQQILNVKEKEAMSNGNQPTEVFIKISNSDTVVSDKKSGRSDTGKCEALDIRDQLLDQQTKSYIEGKGTDDPSSIEEGDNSIENSELWQLTSEFNRKTRENPKDIQVWLDFVKFQDRFEYEEMIANKFTESHTQKKLPKQVITDKKILILQKAISANPDCLLLKMKYLELCQDNLDPDQVDQEMKSLLSANPTNMTLWKRYLTFGQTRMAVFSVTKTAQLYSECFQRLLSFKDKQYKDVFEVSDLDLLYIFVQYCYFQDQAGHKEKALACFQALIEFNIFCPQPLMNSSKGDKCVVFESFWDSGVARMGENGARGWRYWVGNKDISNSDELLMDQTDSEVVELEILQRGECKWKMWLQIEKLREAFHWLPWRPDLSKNETEEDCEDMDRLVLLEDISPFIFNLRTSDHNFQLVLEFLQFIGVSLNNHFLPQMVKASESQLNLDRLSQVMLRRDESIFRPELLESDCEISPARKNFIDNVFQQLTQSSYFEHSQESMLTALWLSFQTSPNLSVPASLKTVKKFAKNLLKETQNRNNLYVWCEYVNQLRYLGGLKDAKSVAEMAFTLQGSTADQDDFARCGFTKLCRVYVEILLGVPAQSRKFMDKSGERISSDQVTEALQCLICFAEKENFKSRTQIKVGGTLLLKVSKKFKEMCESMLQNLSKDFSESQDSLSIFKLEHLGEIAKCFALFSWCVNQELNKFVDVLDSVLSSVQQCISSTKSDKPDSSTTQIHVRLSYALEEIHQYKSHFILFLMSVVPFPLHHLRDAVTQALQTFPQHRFFLSVFVDIEQRGQITGRLDRYFNSVLKEDVTPVAVTYAVYNLLRRLHFGVEQKVNQSGGQEQKDGQTETLASENREVKSGIMHKLRSYLERAVNCQTVQHCPLVWRLYLHTEMRFGTVERTRGIFYRALQQCPWAKALYLDGVAVFGEEKLQDMTDLLLEKELRLQIPLEELDILLDKE